METSVFFSKEEVQKSALCQENHLMFFWDMKGPILAHFQVHGQTVNSADYCALLRNTLKSAIHSKRTGMLSKTVLLQHDNLRLHTAAATAETVQQLGFERLRHPPYSLDLALSNYHIFGPLKEMQHSGRFTSDDEVKEAVHTWLREQLKSFFSAEIQKLGLHNKVLCLIAHSYFSKCIVLHGDYEKVIYSVAHSYFC